MATRRFNYKDDWVLKDCNIGINSETPVNKLDAASGTVKIGIGNVKVSSGSTFANLSGYLNKDHNITYTRTVDYGTSSSLSGDIVVGAGNALIVGSGVTTGQGSINSLKVSNTFNPPIGGTDERPTAPQPGTLYYNKDFRTIEYWDGNFWRQVDNTATRGRGVFLGGAVPTTGGPSIDFINISSLGNSISFGSLLAATSQLAGCSSEIRGVAGGGEAPGVTDTIQYITIASEGNAIDFGNLTDARRRMQDCACSSSTRGLFCAGYDGSNTINTIDYVEISTVGNAEDFGDLTGTRESGACCSSPTRGIYAGGRNQPGNAAFPDIQSFTIASKGNAVRFGDLSMARYGVGGLSNSTRGIFFQGRGGSSPHTNVMDYITIASEGNALDFGDAHEKLNYPAGTASATRGMLVGGSDPSASTNTINYVTIATLGDAKDFGDMGFIRQEFTAISDCHGGLGGF